MGVEERDLRRELVDGHPAALDDRVAIGDAVGQGEGHLLDGVGAGVAEVRPATEIALNRGTSAAQNSMVSAIRRSDGSGGQIQVPRDAYS